MANLETVLTKISCGKQLEPVTSFSPGKRPNNDEIMNALSGLNRLEMNYLFFTYLQESSALKMKATLSYSSKNFLENKGAKVDPILVIRIVKLVLDGLVTTTGKICTHCGGYGIVEGNKCDKCLGTGKIATSQRQIARTLKLSWSTYHRNKILNELYTHLINFCGLIDSNVRYHVTNQLNSLQ